MIVKTSKKVKVYIFRVMILCILSFLYLTSDDHLLLHWPFLYHNPTSCPFCED